MATTPPFRRLAGAKITKSPLGANVTARIELDSGLIEFAAYRISSSQLTFRDLQVSSANVTSSDTQENPLNTLASANHAPTTCQEVTL